MSPQGSIVFMVINLAIFFFFPACSLSSIFLCDAIVTCLDASCLLNGKAC